MYSSEIQLLKVDEFFSFVRYFENNYNWFGRAIDVYND